ncbi:MAG: hypothetical protein Kilf2KO_39010 [Rhodospirillales bacterium]
MDLLLTPISDSALSTWDLSLAEWFFYGSIGLFFFELLRYAFLKRLGWRLLGDSFANAAVFSGYTAVSYLVFYSLYGSLFFLTHELALFDIESTWLTVAVCILLADLLYYWEHRFTHRANLAWATHAVHHSSPHFNLSVAYRFGPLDDLWAISFSLPLLLVGFEPFLVFFATAFVLLYQTLLHTEAVGRLPRPIEAIFNTPSHHRVHHGRNPQYLDRNYGGIFIVWDRLFGTFAKEEERVVYGLVTQIETINPIKVWLKSHFDLARDVVRAPGPLNKIAILVKPPGWQPKKAKSGATRRAAEEGV